MIEGLINLPQRNVWFNGEAYVVAGRKGRTIATYN